MTLNYTEISLTLLWFSLYFENTYFLALCKSNTWLILVAFSAVPIFDSTAYERMRRLRNLTMFTFWTGHLLVHVVPLLFLHNIRCSWWDGVRASVMHLTWVAYESKGTFLLDHVYVPLRQHIWITCSLSGCIFSIICPLLFNVISQL